jgi:hypothetical protein
MTSGARPRALTVAAMMVVAAGASAQTLDPSADWRTLSTRHFEVHFTPALELVARRGAAQAESAYVQLAGLLHPPRGRIDLVFADDVDFSNGFATPVPTNRVIVYATPPVSTRSLRFYDDWLREVITHELVHTFHMDRARGVWRFGQYVFGRSPWLMPNLYSPAWVSEGLAVYLESRLSNAGRARASHQRMLARAAALAGDFPRLDALSLATSRYPGGDMAYGYGGMFLAELARAHGDSAIRAFVERSSGAIIPYRLNHLARQAFGVSFADAWADWRDSIRASAGPVSDEPLPAWRSLTSDGFLVAYPRWADGASLLAVQATGREVPGLVRVDSAGGVRRVARRNSVDANVAFPGGGVLFAQLEFVDAHHIRSDLYLERDGDARRLTTGARLSEPDAREDGRIVAVQGVPGTTRLVLLSPEGADLTPVTAASLDTQWAAPRWSPDGGRIAAVRWTRGAYADIVVLDTTGRLLARLTNDRAVDGAPAWHPSGDAVLFASDRDGTPALYVAEVLAPDGVPPAVHRVSAPALGLDHPAPSPNGAALAATSYREGGWHLGVGDLRLDALAVALVPDETVPPDPAPEPVRDPSRGYTPWRTLRPTAWLPLIGEAASGRASYGGAVNGGDVIGRHAYTAEALFDPEDREHEWSALYRYRGLGQPVISLAGSQEWGRGVIVDSTRAAIGALHRRARFASLAAALERPRMRTHAFVTMGGEIEWRDYATAPASLLGQLDPFFASQPEFRSLVLSTGFNNARRPPLSISPENGISLAARGQLDWRRGVSGLESRSLTAVASAYRSLPFGGFAHHVLAARLAGAASNGRNAALFEVGGTSGSAITLLPGIGFGERRSLGVRGFPPGSLIGTRALVGTVEYRAPLTLLHRGVWWLPAFLDRASLSFYGDAGSAGFERLIPELDGPDLIASLGAEVATNIALQYDVPYLLRLGIGVPVRGRVRSGADAAEAYVRIGASF